MRYRRLGRTTLRVSVIAVGTVSLGTPYGLDADAEPPSRDESLRILRDAAEAGINFFDTAPAYGTSEDLVGEALGPRDGCWIATKVNTPPRDDPGAREAVARSIESSRRRLRRDVLDVVQIHNATAGVIAGGGMVEALVREQQLGRVRFLGASVYSDEDAMAVIEAGCFDVVQVAYNVLDQRKAREVLPAARRAEVAVVARSVLLKGVLTPRSRALSPALTPLHEAADRARIALDASWETLPTQAIRFCLSSDDLATVLVGVSSRLELDEALAAEAAGPLPGDLLARTPALALESDALLNPSRWPAS